MVTIILTAAVVTLELFTPQYLKSFLNLDFLALQSMVTLFKLK